MVDKNTFTFYKGGMKPLKLEGMFRSQNKSKGKAGLEHDIAVRRARSFLHTMTPCESKALDDVRAKAGLIMHGIAPRIFKGKLNVTSQVEKWH